MAEALGVSLKGKKIKKVCSLCGSEDVLADAYAEWNVEEQEWELTSVFLDKGCFCNKCEEECDIEDVEVEDEI